MFANGSGSGVRNGAGPVARVSLPGTLLYKDSYIDRGEFVRLVVQCLRDVGYRMEAPEVSHFRQCILNANWSEAEDALAYLGVTDEDSMRMARFLISEQKYLELLEAGSVNEALYVLRSELAPLKPDVDKLHSLSGLIMCSSADDLKTRAKWDGSEGTSRRQLLATLQEFIPASTMIPERRFATLLEEAFQYQRMNCLYHNALYTPEAFSLFTDHTCTRDSFPTLTTNILTGHNDEVWNIQWSHDGQYLASASKDKTAHIWYLNPGFGSGLAECSSERVLKDHDFHVGCLAWSPDDTLLLTSADNVIKVWNVKTGVCLRELKTHTETVTALEWLPDGQKFISGSMDRKIIIWDMDDDDGVVWISTPIRVTDLAIAPDLSRLVAVGLDHHPASANNSSASLHDSQAAGTATPQQAAAVIAAASRTTNENRLMVFDFGTRTQELSTRLEGELTSVKISQDSRYALVNHAPDEVQLWDLETGRMARKFTGQRQGQHVIRSCFGGVDGNFIVSGSEDGKVYVWHRDTGALLDVLGGHGEGSVNAVAWNPRHERMFASCSDDKSVRIWQPPTAAAQEEGQQPSEQNGAGKGKTREGWPPVSEFGGGGGASSSSRSTN